MTLPAQDGRGSTFPTRRSWLRWPGRVLAAVAVGVVMLLAGATAANAYVYWANLGTGTIGRSNLDGTGVNQSFVAADARFGVAVDASHIYWTNNLTETIGRANLDGTGVNNSFITGATGAFDIAVDASHIYWATLTDTIGRANLDGTGVNNSFITGGDMTEGVAIDASHVYWTNTSANTIGRANLDGTGANQSFIATGSAPTALTVSSTHIYWDNFTDGGIGRANLDGTGVNNSFITGGNTTEGVAVNETHIYWGNRQSDTIGRANLDGTGVNQSFVTGADSPTQVALGGVPQPQAITFPQPADTAVNAGPVTLGATASSGLPVSYTSGTPGVCTVTGNKVTLLAVGTCTISADQAGDDGWLAAPRVQRSFQITPAVGQAQIPIGGCVTTGGTNSIPRAGTRRLAKPGCVTNAGQKVGASVSAQLRGDARYYSLYCQVSPTKTTATRATGYPNASRYCKAGILKIRTYGYRLKLRITWSAPAVGVYSPFTLVRSYRT